MSEISRPAHAKVNVFLRVIARRADGFHDIESLLVPVSLHDRLLVRPSSRLSVSIAGEGAAAVAGGENLALLAARELASSARITDRGAEIIIEKLIPIAAGLGGGSADAAATLLALNEMWELGFTYADLSEIGARIGSDVPALLAGGPVFVRGRGETAQPVLMVATTWVLAPIPLSVRARDAYAWWDEDGATGPDPGALIAAAETGSLGLLGSALFNDLQPAVLRRYPEVAAKVDALREGGALGVVMSGSGPTVAALARDRSHAGRLAKAVPGSIVVSGAPGKRERR